MATILSNFQETIAPTAEDAILAQQSSKLLARFVAEKSKKPLSLRIQSEGSPDETISIPASAIRLLADILVQMAKGNAVTLIPIHAELTTQQAADIINVSRPFLVEQLAKNMIPFRMVGTHRRVLFKDLMEYKEAIDRKRLKVLEELSAMDQELGLQ